jgi:putative transcriptional regulator
MDLKLRERLERLGPIRDIDRVACGSAAVLVLRLPARPPENLRPIDAMFALARRGITMLRAKRSIETLIETGRMFIHLPTVESVETLVRELAAAGVAAASVDATTRIDVRSLRERLGLTREQFALRFGLEVDTLRNWEAGRRDMDAAAAAYLRAISNDPEAVERAYAPTPDALAPQS